MVHLQLVEGLEVESFMCCFRRFCANNPLLNGTYNVNRDSKEFRFSERSEEEIISVISTFKTS